MFLLLGAPAWQGICSVGRIKMGVALGPRPRAVLSPINPLRRGWLQPRQKAPLRNRFQFNNNRFKVLLRPPSILQLRLTALTKRGPKKVHATPATIAAQQIIPSTDWRMVTSIASCTQRANRALNYDRLFLITPPRKQSNNMYQVIVSY
jgi:hypothetical protein